MPLRPPSPGVLVDNKYRLAERIGGGGMGDVFRAEIVASGRPVAIKFLHPELAQNMEVAQRFFQEAQAVNKIRHPNVVEVLDAGTADVGPYIVMEYLDGESVGAALTRVGRFDVDAAVGTAVPVLEALDAAHRVGIIHRDLKPENIFIAVDATRTNILVRLLDFGIAKVLDAPGPSPRTRTGVVFGTPDYLSPEQATGDGPLDGRSDLFAVGVLLYELLTGLRPFRAPTAVATAFKVVHADAPSIAAAGVHVDTKLEAVVHRLLQKEPSRRFPAAPEVIRELDKVSPDPVRRAVALAKIVGAMRRMTQSQGPLDADRAISGRDSGIPTRRLTPSMGQAATQPNPRTTVVAPRVADPRSSRSPMGSSPDLPRPSGSSRNSSPGNGPASTPSPGSGRGSQVPALVEASSSPTARPPAVRPFPARHAGQFQVRGPVLRSVDKAILALFGQAARDDVVAHVPDRYAADLRSGSINALVSYELEALDAYMEYATAKLLHDPARWREIGRKSLDGELHVVMRPLLKPTRDIGALVRRGVATWARLFSFGAWRVGTAPNGKVSLTIGELDAVAQPLRWWLVGLVEQTMRRAVRPDLRITITGGDQDWAPDLACEIG